MQLKYLGLGSAESYLNCFILFESEVVMKEYQGHRSWNAWNVSLWICNDEPLYRFAMECIGWARKWAKTVRSGYWRNKEHKNSRIIRRAVNVFMKYYQQEKTPDGAKYNYLSVRLCLDGLLAD